MGITVRRIRAGEGELLKSIRLAALADTPSAFAMTLAEETGYSDQYWFTAAQERSVGSTQATFLALGDNSAAPAIGIVGCYFPDSATPPAELVSMWVRADGRGSGAAGRLVDAAVDWARHTDAEAVELWVTHGNDRAIAFYEKAGFVSTLDHEPLPSDPCRDQLRYRLPLAAR